jgi:signal transduction histidine kinase
VNWSAETARLYGLDPGYRPTLDEGIGFYAPEARPLVRAAVEKSMVDGQAWELEVPLIRADGRRIWARVVASVELTDGKPVRLVGAFQDVTARVAEQSALQEAKTRFALATESSGIAIWDWDISKDRFTVDDRLFELYGVIRETVDHSDLEFWVRRLHPDDRTGVQQALQACMDGIKAYDTEFRVVWDDGSIRYLNATGQVVLRDEAGQAVRMIGTNMDITDLVLAGETSRRAMKIAEDSSRIKSDFLANMSHEIRTPMNAILGMTHLALRAHPTEQQRGYMTKIGNAAQSLLSIMNDILDFSKIEAGKLELEHITFSLDDVWNNLMDIVGQRAEQKKIVIDWSVGPDTPRCLKGDPLRLGQILINLVNNAIKFTEKGKIVVGVTSEELSPGLGQFRFSVSDTGIGMSTEQIANLFQSFTRRTHRLRASTAARDWASRSANNSAS